MWVEDEAAFGVCEDEGVGWRWNRSDRRDTLRGTGRGTVDVERQEGD